MAKKAAFDITFSAVQITFQTMDTFSSIIMQVYQQIQEVENDLSHFVTIGWSIKDFTGEWALRDWYTYFTLVFG